MTETAFDRLDYLQTFDPLVRTWVAEQRLSAGDADLLMLAAEAAERSDRLRVSLPAGLTPLAGLIAACVAVRTMLRPSRFGSGPVALLAGVPERRAFQELTVGGEPLAKALHAGRLRGDGLVQGVNGGKVSMLTAEHRFMFVSPRAGWPDLGAQRCSVSVVAANAMGAALDDALAWSTRFAGVTVVVDDLDPNATDGGFVVDWPFLNGDIHRWPHSAAWPVAGAASITDVGEAPLSLLEARRRIADGAKRGGRWPRQLSHAAGLSRALASAPVPLSLYDAHTVGTIARSFSDRIDDLREMRASDFPFEWAAFAETDWAVIKAGLLEAVEQIEAHNRKAPAIGILIEELLRDGGDLDVWVETDIQRDALATYLLTSGFAVDAEHFDSGRLAIRTWRSTSRPAHTARRSLLTGLPATWHQSALVSAHVGGPLHVVGYHFEAERVPRYLGWAVNHARQENHDHRQVVLASALGVGVLPDSVPEPVSLSCDTAVLDDTTDVRRREIGDDAAEFAALADDEWFKRFTEEQESTESKATLVESIAFLVDPGPSVLCLGRYAIVDRLVDGRLRPVPATTLEPGMRILGVAATAGGVFERIRPLLDGLKGPGTVFWLDQWAAAFAAASAVSGGSIGLAHRLSAHGTDITAQAVRGWSQPFRIGPRDAENVRRVADVANKPVVARNYLRIAAVMEGVRIEHQKIGRELASAVREHVDGNTAAFEPLEEYLGVEIEQLLGSVAVHTIREALAGGTAPRSALGIAHAPAAAQAVFTPGDPR